MVAATKKRQGLALASAADPRTQSMACGTMLPTLVLRGALEMLWRGVAIPPFHSIFISFLSFHFLPLLSTSIHAPVPVPVAVFSFSFSFPFCSCPFRFVPALSFFCALFSRPFFFLPLLLSCPFLSLCVSSFFPCWTVVAKFGRLPEPPATGSSPSLLPTSLSAGGCGYRYNSALELAIGVPFGQL